MATTTIKVRAAVGETEVTLTRIAGTLCSISVSQALTGNWHCIDSVGTETLIQDLVDEAITVELGEVPSAADVLAEFGDGSDLTALLTPTGFSTHSAADVWSVATRVLTAGTNLPLLDAAGVRTAVGLASANLDTQIADLPTVAEFED